MFCLSVALQKKAAVRGRQTTLRSLPPRHAAHGRGLVPPGKGIFGFAPSGRGILDDLPSSAAVLSSHYHRKPATALYGHTAKKPAGAVNILHKPFGGGDGPVRKPAVHVGIPHAKIPEKNIHVRCTWETNSVAVQRTVTNMSSKQPHTSSPTVYRAPTPPEFTTDADHHPSRPGPVCQDDLRRKLERMRLRVTSETLVFFSLLLIALSNKSK